MSAGIVGRDILEVWDYRLSTAYPVINNSGDEWVVEIHDKSAPDYDPDNPDVVASPLDVFKTGIPAVEGDSFDEEKIKPCFEWLKSVRDKYSAPDIDVLKPLAKDVREAQAKLHTALSGRGRKEANIIKAAVAEGVDVSAAESMVDGGAK